MAWEMLYQKMSKIFLLIFLLGTFLFSKSSFWSYTYSYSLKKDKLVKVEIKKDYLPTKNSDGILEFRWTLYSAKKLVLLVSYEGFKTQYVLEKQYKRDAISINLIGDYKSIRSKAFAVIKFSDFDDKKKIANLEVMIRDSDKRMEVRFLDD